MKPVELCVEDGDDQHIKTVLIRPENIKFVESSHLGRGKFLINIYLYDPPVMYTATPLRGHAYYNLMRDLRIALASTQAVKEMEAV